MFFRAGPTSTFRVELGKDSDGVAVCGGMLGGLEGRGWKDGWSCQLVVDGLSLLGGSSVLLEPEVGFFFDFRSPFCACRSSFDFNQPLMGDLSPNK